MNRTNHAVSARLPATGSTLVGVAGLKTVVLILALTGCGEGRNPVSAALDRARAVVGGGGPCDARPKDAPSPSGRVANALRLIRSAGGAADRAIGILAEVPASEFEAAIPALIELVEDVPDSSAALDALGLLCRRASSRPEVRSLVVRLMEEARRASDEALAQAVMNRMLVEVSADGEERAAYYRCALGVAAVGHAHRFAADAPECFTSEVERCYLRFAETYLEVYQRELEDLPAFDRIFVSALLGDSYTSSLLRPAARALMDASARSDAVREKTVKLLERAADISEDTAWTLAWFLVSQEDGERELRYIVDAGATDLIRKAARGVLAERAFYREVPALRSALLDALEQSDLAGALEAVGAIERAAPKPTLAADVISGVLTGETRVAAEALGAAGATRKQRVEFVAALRRLFDRKDVDDRVRTATYSVFSGGVEAVLRSGDPVATADVLDALGVTTLWIETQPQKESSPDPFAMFHRDTRRKPDVAPVSTWAEPLVSGIRRDTTAIDRALRDDSIETRPHRLTLLRALVLAARERDEWKSDIGEVVRDRMVAAFESALKENKAPAAIGEMLESTAWYRTFFQVDMARLERSFFAWVESMCLEASDPSIARQLGSLESIAKSFGVDQRELRAVLKKAAENAVRRRVSEARTIEDLLRAGEPMARLSEAGLIPAQSGRETPVTHEELVEALGRCLPPPGKATRASLGDRSWVATMLEAWPTRDRTLAELFRSRLSKMRGAAPDSDALAFELELARRGRLEAGDVARILLDGSGGESMERRIALLACLFRAGFAWPGEAAEAAVEWAANRLLSPDGPGVAGDLKHLKDVFGWVEAGKILGRSLADRVGPAPDPTQTVKLVTAILEWSQRGAPWLFRHAGAGLDDARRETLARGLAAADVSPNRKEALFEVLAGKLGPMPRAAVLAFREALVRDRPESDPRLDDAVASYLEIAGEDRPAAIANKVVGYLLERDQWWDARTWVVPGASIAADRLEAIRRAQSLLDMLHSWKDPEPGRAGQMLATWFLPDKGERGRSRLYLQVEEVDGPAFRALVFGGERGLSSGVCHQKVVGRVSPAGIRIESVVDGRFRYERGQLLAGTFDLVEGRALLGRRILEGVADDAELERQKVRARDFRLMLLPRDPDLVLLDAVRATSNQPVIYVAEDGASNPRFAMRMRGKATWPVAHVLKSGGWRLRGAAVNLEERRGRLLSIDVAVDGRLVQTLTVDRRSGARLEIDVALPSGGQDLTLVVRENRSSATADLLDLRLERGR